MALHVTEMGKAENPKIFITVTGDVEAAVRTTVCADPGALLTVGVNALVPKARWGKLKLKNLVTSAVTAESTEPAVIARRPASTAASQACCIRVREA
ncbi:hypothetical protein [Sphingomonas sp. GV3]|uniref:hypothetical protein n=1 Tax=Sphingomonas sp. GV3 TaxID=3040671 RepID=UPI00280BE1E0|nr:hypothetical protein [Sphingomonas sp. GV3]